MADSQKHAEPRKGWFLSVVEGAMRFLWRMILRFFGLGGRDARGRLEPLDQHYREYVDRWVSESLARWLHETRSDIDVERATKVLMGESERYPEAAAMVRETLVDAKVTFSQRDSKQYLEVEAYMAPRQINGTQPQVLRWRAEREIDWQEIPDDVRERLIRVRQPVTLGYVVPTGTR